jgi:hypothetical protein
MAPQLGMGTFRVSHSGWLPTQWDSYATANGADKETWALNKVGFMKPGTVNPQVTMYVQLVSPDYNADICHYLEDLGLDPRQFEIWYHTKRRDDCYAQASKTAK